MAEIQELLKDVIETRERGKSNAKRIDKVEIKINELEKKEEAMFEIATSVKLIAQNVENMQRNVSDMRQGFREDLAQVKAGQNETNKRIDEVKQELDNVKYKPMVDQYENAKKLRREIAMKIILAVLGAAGAATLTVLNILGIN